MKSTQRKKTVLRNKLHSQDSTSAISHKPKTRRRFTSALRRFTIKTVKTKHSSSSKSESDFSVKSEKEFILDYSQFKHTKKSLEVTSSLNLNCLPLWSNPVFTSKTVQAKTSSLVNEYSMDPSDESIKNTETSLNKPTDTLIIDPTDLPSVSQSENNSPLNFENPTLSSTLNNPKYFTENNNYPSCSRPLGSNFNISLQAFNVVPSSFIPDTSNTLNVPLSIALKDVLDLAVYLQENEAHIKHTLSKYIRNESLQKELLNVLSGHNKIQTENERRCYKLANELFSLELDHAKTREKTLQESLDVAAYFNRILEEEIQILKEKNEKLVVDYQHERKCCDDIFIKSADDLHRNNSELRNKYKNVIGEVKKLDNELRSLQNQNRSLVAQLANANGQIRNYRDMLHREMGEHELEHVALSHQLQINEQIIKDCVEAGDVLIDDLMVIKKQLKPLSLDINWTKFKNRGSTIVDLLHLSRNCLNEITRELLNINNKTNIQQKNTINHVNKKEQIDSKVNDNNIFSYESKIQLQTQKIQIMKSEIDLAKREKEIIAESLKNEKIKTESQEKIIEELKTQITNRDLIIKNLNCNLDECRNQVQALTFKINGMQKFFDDNQLSDVLHELLETQNKCSSFEKQFYQLELDKQNLSDKVQKVDYEKDSLLKYQQSFFEHLQQQQRDIEELNRQNNELKKQLTNERTKLMGKSAELAKQIEATNLMQTVQSQMNVEYSKNLSLEANALTTNYELNRLSVVAEYNNEISKQLKEMIAAKDKTISELKANLDKLNENEKKNLQEKASLCNEITEASYIIKQLQKELENEKHDRKKIASEKERNEKNADCKIQELHQMIIEERQALRALLKEYQNVLNQKNNIESLHKEQLSQIEHYAKNEEKMKSSMKEVNEKCNELERKCDKLNKKLDEVYEIIDAKESKVRNCTNEYENKLSARDGIIEKQKCKNEELQNTIQYLQCNIQKLQSDLNELRTNEKAKTDQIKQCSSIIDKFQRDVEEQKVLFDKCYAEKQQLEERLTEAIVQYNSLYDEYNKYYEDTQQMEAQYKIELENYKQLNSKKSQSIELLEKCSKENIAHLEKKQLEINNIKEEMERLDKVRSEFFEKTRILEEALNKQQKMDENLIHEKDRCLQKVKKLSEAVTALKSELQKCLKQRDEDISNFKKFTADLKNDSETHKKIMMDDLNKLSNELGELSEKCTTKSTKLHDLKIQYKEMTDNMKKVLNLLIKERYEHKIVEAQNKLLNKELEDLKSKFDASNNTIAEIGTQDVTYLENVRKSDLENAKKCLDDATNNIEYLEREVHITTDKLRKLEQITIMQENYMISQLQNKSELLKSVNKEHEILLERYNKLKQHSKMTNKVIIALKAEIEHLHQTIQILEFQKCDLTLKYHELNGKLQNEESLNRTLKQTHQHFLAAAYDMSSVSSIQSISNNLD